MPEEGSLIYSKADMPKKKKNKNCQAESNKGSAKPKKDMQPETPAIHSRNKKLMYSDKNCEETKKPKKPKSVMQSVTKEENTEDVQLPKPEGLCRDKNCQSTRCYKHISSRRPKCDKNCQL